MSLDDRLRDELRNAADLGQLREDDAFESVRLKYHRGLVPNGVTRQAIVVAVVLTLFASVAMVVSWRNTPDRFRSTATLRVATASTSRVLILADPRKLAVAADTRRATLASAHLSDDTPVDFQATLNSERDLLTLSAVAPSAHESRDVTHEWVSAFTKARRAEAVRALRAADLALMRRVKALHNRLNAINAELVRIDPVTYKGHDLGFHPPNGHPYTERPIPVPEQGSTHELNLANERVQILAMLADFGAESARSKIANLSPNVDATPVAQTQAVRVDASSPATVPILVGWAISLLVVFAGAFFIYRRRRRSTGQVSE
jgi:hypothetical protein